MGTSPTARLKKSHRLVQMLRPNGLVFQRSSAAARGIPVERTPRAWTRLWSRWRIASCTKARVRGNQGAEHAACGMTISRISDHGPYNVTTFSMCTSNALERRHRFDVWLLLSSARFGGAQIWSNPTLTGQGVYPQKKTKVWWFIRNKKHI